MRERRFTLRLEGVVSPELYHLITGETMHPGTPRDVDLADWLNSAAFHPADTPRKQLGHEAARQLVALLGAHLHQLIPPSREKSVIFSHLEQVRHYANQALAVHQGPPEVLHEDALRFLVEDTQRIAAEIGAELAADARINEYKAGQLAEAAEKAFTQVKYSTGEEPEMVRSLSVRYMPEYGDPFVDITVQEHHENENVSRRAAIQVDDPEVLEELAAAFLAAANRLRADGATIVRTPIADPEPEPLDVPLQRSELGPE